MARITVEDCLTKETNRFALVLLAAKRTKQILRGAPVVIDDKRDNKSVVTSLREIAGGKVRFKTEEDLAREREETERRRQEELAAREKISGSENGGSGGADSGEQGSEDGNASNSDEDKVSTVESSSMA